MAVCGSLQHIFEKPLPENPTLIESLSQWNRHQMKTRKSLDLPSFSEIFGELHFHEKNNHHLPDSSSSPPHSSFSLQPLLIEDKDGNADGKEKDNTDDNPSSSSSSAWSSLSSLDSMDHHSQRSNHSQYEGFSCKSSESLQFCTEGLGSESADDVEDFSPTIANNDNFVFGDSNTNEECEEEEEEMIENSSSHFLCSRRSSFGSSSGATSFPPPISCIGRSGKPWFCFRSYRRDGRFVLKEIKIPTHEFLRACREDGRLRLHFVQPDEEIPEEEEEEEEEDEEEEDEKEDNVIVDEEVVVVGSAKDVEDEV